MKWEFVSNAGSSLSKNSHLDDLPANRRSGILGSFNTRETYVFRRYNLFSCSAYNQETIRIIAIPRYTEYSLASGASEIIRVNICAVLASSCTNDTVSSRLILESFDRLVLASFG